MKKSYDKSLKYRLRLIWAYKDVLRNHVKPVFKRYSESFGKAQDEAAHKLLKKYEESEQGGKPLDVAFILTIPGMWKVDYLFKAFQSDCHYHPYVVVIPYSMFKGFSDDEVETTLDRTRNFVEQKGYEYVVPRTSDGRWEDIKKTLKPDIVFFTTPYKDIPPQYFIYNFKDVLTCYVSYTFTVLSTFQVDYNLIFHNLLGLDLLETEFNKKSAELYARNHGVNAVVSGYPATEVFLRDDYVAENKWKPQDRVKKKVIWAPHHTIDKTIELSTFLLRCDDMVNLAQKYKDSIQFVFKPHQLLKFKLQQEWGVEKVDEYYNKWASMDNTQLEESSYADYFITSDAMIHDSGSFTTEYLYTHKPVMYLTHDDNFAERFSPFGYSAFECHYRGGDVADIEHFLNDVVLGGNDPMKEKRDDFFYRYLKPKDGVLPSAKILQIIENKIKGNQQLK